MRRLFFVVLVVFIFSIPIMPIKAQNTNGDEETLEKEFPQWARDLRRAEIIFFGSIPFTVFFTMISIDTYRWSTNGWDTRYAPWPIKAAGAVPMDMSQQILTFAIGFSAAVGVAIADHIILRIKRNRLEREIQSLPTGDAILIREPVNNTQIIDTPINDTPVNGEPANDTPDNGDVEEN